MKQMGHHEELSSSTTLGVLTPDNKTIELGNFQMVQQFVAKAFQQFIQDFGIEQDLLEDKQKLGRGDCNVPFQKKGEIESQSIQIPRNNKGLT